MLELSPARKNKINLADYNSKQDIENRMLLADFSSLEHRVLEEILFSPLKFSLRKLAKNIGCDEQELLTVLKKLSQTSLLSIQDDSIVVDKDLRKYFESQLTRFDPEFRPDMEFIQAILRKVPIHLLPTWYSVPRSSNNIFESLVEKYLLTPQIFHRYLSELNLGDPILSRIIEDVFSAPDFKIPSTDLISKYNLSRRDFEEMLLFLEFNFVCCLTYEKEEDHWIEWVAPFHEWHEYLRFLKKTEAPPIADENGIVPYRERDFAFIEDLSAILVQTKKVPLPANPNEASLKKDFAPLLSLPAQTEQEIAFLKSYVHLLIEKGAILQLLEKMDSKISLSTGADHWLDLNPENQALYFYRHPQNKILRPNLSPEVATERHIREAEKSIKRALHGKWVLVDDFLEGVLVPLSEHSVVMLKRVGKHWKYALPTYTEEEKELIRATLLEWLFEMGMVTKGTFQGKDCFRATPFGRFFFEE